MIKISNLLLCSFEALGVGEIYTVTSANKVGAKKNKIFLKKDWKKITKERIQTLNLDDKYLHYFVEKFTSIYRVKKFGKYPINEEEINSLAVISIYLIERLLRLDKIDLMKSLISSEELNLLELKIKLGNL